MESSYQRGSAEIMREAWHRTRRSQLARMAPARYTPPSFIPRSPYPAQSHIASPEGAAPSRPDSTSNTSQQDISPNAIVRLPVRPHEDNSERCISEDCPWVAPDVESAINAIDQLRDAFGSTKEELRKQLFDAQHGPRSEQAAQKLAIVLQCKSIISQVAGALTEALQTIDGSVISLTVNAQGFHRELLGDLCLDERQTALISISGSAASSKPQAEGKADEHELSPADELLSFDESVADESEVRN